MLLFTADLLKKNCADLFGEFLRIVPRDGFGSDFPEDQHDDGDDGGGYRGSDIAHPSDEKDGGDSGQKNVDQVVADQHGGDQPVVLVGQADGQGGPFVPALSHGLHAGFVHGRKGGLRGGEKRRKQDAHQHPENRSQGTYVHSEFRLLQIIRPVSAARRRLPAQH